MRRTVERFAHLCQADARVLAAFVGGSLATGTADDYSDLDLYLLTTDDGYASFFAEREGFMRRLGEPVYWEDFNGFGFDMVLFIFADGVKGELGLARASHFLHIHGGPYHVLVDKKGLLQGVTFPLDQVPPEKQRLNLERLLKSFWRHLYLFTGALGRSRLLTATSYLEGMRHVLVHACRLALDFADGGDHPPAEALLPPGMVTALKPTFAHLDQAEMLAAAQAAVRLFQATAKPLAQAQGAEYPEALERVVLARFQAISYTEVMDCGNPPRSSPHYRCEET